MTTDPQPDAEPELTDVQKAYNVAQSDLFHLAAYGHFRYWPTGHALPGTEDDARRKGYCARINMAREHLEAAVLRLVAEHAETFRGDWGIVAAWLRSLADDPAELSLLAVRPDERPATAAPAAAPSAPADRAALRDRIRRAVCEAEGFAWDTDMLEPDEYGEVADTVLAVLPAPADRAAGPAALREAAAFYESVLQQSLDPDSDPRYCTAVRDVVMGLRRRADEAQQTAPWLSDSARIGRTLIWTWADIGNGVYGQGYRAAQTEARALLTGQRDSDEAQQPEADGADQCSGCRYVPCGNCPPAAGAQQPKEA